MAIELPSPMLCYIAEFHPKTNMEPSWNNTGLLLGNDQQIFTEPLNAYENSKEMGLITDFKKIQQTDFHSRHLIQVEVPVNSFLLNITDTIAAGTKMHQQNQKMNTLPRDYHSHSCFQSPSKGRRSRTTHDDVGYNIQKMRHTQFIGQCNLLRRGKRGHPISCLLADWRWIQS